MNIQLHASGSVKGQQPTFSRKPAGKQLVLHVSPDKQMVTVCIQGECYQAIISQAAICPPNRSPWTRIPLRATFDLVSVKTPGEHMPSYSVKVTLFIYLCFPLLLDLTASFRLSSDSGADDLLPILSFVALQCQCPQLVSECAALEEFIHEGWVIIMEKHAHWPSPFVSTKKTKSYLSRFFSLIPVDTADSLTYLLQYSRHATALFRSSTSLCCALNTCLVFSWQTPHQVAQIVYDVNPNSLFKCSSPPN